MWTEQLVNDGWGFGVSLPACSLLLGQECSCCWGRSAPTKRNHPELVFSTMGPTIHSLERSSKLLSGLNI